MAEQEQLISSEDWEMVNALIGRTDLQTTFSLDFSSATYGSRGAPAHCGSHLISNQALTTPAFTTCVDFDLPQRSLDQ